MTSDREGVLTRSSGQKSYRKVVVIATEGQVTEREYFRCIQELFSVGCTIDFAGPGSSCCSNPREVLAKMRNYLTNSGGLKSGDEAWLVVDKDEWGKDQLEPLSRWVADRPEKGYKRGLALSNPDFEYWLLLHFEDTGVRNRDDCLEKLKKHLPKYDKHIESRKYSEERVKAAIERARGRDKSSRRAAGHSGVYLLVSDVLEP
ncbi:MAG: RloB family protein [Candidatus Cryosericum sp.]